jgi:hypothetical protein
MAYLVTAASAWPFAPDRRYWSWSRFIEALARLGRALAAERGRRRAIRRLRGVDGRLMADHLTRFSREIHFRLNVGSLAVSDQR